MKTSGFLFRLLFLALCLLVLTGPAPLPPSWTYTTLLSDGKYKLVSIKPTCEKKGEKTVTLTAQEFREKKLSIIRKSVIRCKRESYTSITTKRVKNGYEVTSAIIQPVIKSPFKNTYGVAYPASGLYRNDESTIPLWTMEAMIKGSIHLSQDADYMAVVSNKMNNQPAITFYYKGKPIKEYYYQEVISDRKLMVHISDSGTVWKYKDSFDDNTNRLSLITLSKDRYTFDIKTGDIISGPPTPMLSIVGKLQAVNAKAVLLKNIHVCRDFLALTHLVEQPVVEPALLVYTQVLYPETGGILSKDELIPMSGIRRIVNNNSGNPLYTTLTLALKQSNEQRQIYMDTYKEICGTHTTGEQVSFRLKDIQSITEMRAIKDKVKPSSRNHEAISKIKLLKVLFNSPFHGFAIAMRWGKPTVLMTQDGGINWSILHTDTDADFYPLDIVFETGQKGWVVGTHGTYLTSTDRGLTWKKMTHLDRKQRHKLMLISHNQPSNSQLLAFTSTHKALNVTYLDDDYVSPSDKLVNDHTYSQMTAIDSNHLWVVHNGRELFQSSTGGKDWQAVKLPHPMSYIRQIHFVDNQHGWLLGRTQSDGPYQLATPVLLATRDGGKSWNYMLR